MAAKLIRFSSYASTVFKCPDHSSAVCGRQVITPLQQQLLRYSRTSRQVGHTSKNVTDKTKIVTADVSKTSQIQPPTEKDYEYFKHMGAAARSVLLDSKHHAAFNISSDLSLSKQISETASKEDVIGGVIKVEDIVSGVSLSSCTPALPVRSFNLAAYVNDSELLSNLVLLGVDLSKIETNAVVADQLVKMDFNEDVKPILLFLHNVGVSDKDIGKNITKCPSILFESVDNMQVRINYLESKKFSKEAVVRLISKQPAILITPTKEIDSQLGYLQKDFMLKGEEVRQVVTQYPKLVFWSKIKIKDIKLKLKEFLGFSESELRQLLLLCPKLYTSDKHAIAKRFDYLHNVIGYSHNEIVQCAPCLRTRTTIIRQRHLFLKLLRRDNFDSARENYVSPRGLTTGRDVEFCERIAKVSVKQYNDFLKTL